MSDTIKFDADTWIGWMLCCDELREKEGDVISAITSTEGYTPQALTIDIKINGVKIVPDSFEKMMDYITDRAEEQIKEKAGINSFEKAVLEKAEELLKDKTQGIIDTMYEINELAKPILEGEWVWSKEGDTQGLNQYISVDMINSAREVVDLILHPSVEADEVFIKPIVDLLESLEEANTG